MGTNKRKVGKGKEWCRDASGANSFMKELRKGKRKIRDLKVDISFFVFCF
jgi:hypothetical protein